MNLLKITTEYNEATRILNNGNYKKAMAMYKKIIKEYPCKEAYTNIGNCYRHFGQDKLMFSAYSMALSDKVPFLDINTETHLHAMNNLGLANYMYGRDREAISLYKRALAEKPEFWDCMWNLSTAELRLASSGLSEYFSPGWVHYESRFVKGSPVKMKNKKENLLYWDRKSSYDAPVIVLVEQGIGDAIMFGRYIHLLRKYFSDIYVQCDPSLECIFKDFKCVRDATECPATWAISICSLAGIFHPEIPAGDWLQDLGVAHDFGPGFNVGIVWAGNPSHANDKYRSINIERFHSLSRYCNLYSLSPSFTGNKFVKPLPIQSWVDTANYIRGLDLVISIDTSVIHMTGALGCPGLVLQPFKETDFRWGNSTEDISSSVWYSSIKVIKNPQSWDHVFKTVEEYVKNLTS